MKKFIWINDRKFQKSYHTVFCDKTGYDFGMVEFKKSHDFSEKIRKINMNIFADCRYTLYIGGDGVGTGPACPGGDWGVKKPLSVQYFDSYVFENLGKELEIHLQVKLLPSDFWDVSCGKGGVWAEYRVEFENGKTEIFTADESWECRIDKRFSDLQTVDFDRLDKWEKAVFTESVWNLEPSPLEALEEKKIYPEMVGNKAVFDKIYAGYLCVKTEGEGETIIKLSETGEKQHAVYKIKGSGEIRFPRLESIGEADIELSENAKIKEIFITASHYPIKSAGSFSCNDQSLNEIYNLGRHTADICRQQIELDSPMHKENLGCPGDYMIESLISYLAFGDYSLSRFDIVRIADYLRENDFKMFHTSYSLMWIYMLHDYVMFSGDLTILNETEDVVEGLINRFDGYCKAGILDNLPDYMFIDWVQVDGFTLHHPPKALGQTAMTAFYYKALTVAEKIYKWIDKPADKLCNKAVEVKKAFNQAFFDREKGLYISGLTTPGTPGKWQPENPEKIYFTRQANVMAVYCGLCDDGKTVMENVMTDTAMPPVQPYFMFFVLGALEKCGLFEKYGLLEIHKWDKLVSECNKGLKEGWGDGCGEYNYDYSHAWGGSPTYFLPKMMSGIEILKPGFEEISLNPCLFGLESAEIVIPTPRGKIEMKLGEKTEIKIPKTIRRV